MGIGFLKLSLCEIAQMEALKIVQINDNMPALQSIFTLLLADTYSLLQID
jgi:hypothetical protein